MKLMIQLLEAYEGKEMAQTNSVVKPACWQSDNETVHQVVSFYSVLCDVMAVSQMTL